MKVLITGTAGFIGQTLVLKLLHVGLQLVEVDPITPYYDVSLKHDRLTLSAPFETEPRWKVSVLCHRRLS